MIKLYSNALIVSIKQGNTEWHLVCDSTYKGKTIFEQYNAFRKAVGGGFPESKVSARW